MAEEFNSFLSEAMKSPLEEKVNAFGDIVEKMMTMILRIPDFVDQSLGVITQKLNTLETKINAINNELAMIKSRAPNTSPVVAAPSIPTSAPPPPGGPPGAPPPPPGSPPPPPGGPPKGPGANAARPTNPQSLRGAIMSELKTLFAKRQNQE